MTFIKWKRKLKVLFLCKMLGIHHYQYRLRIKQDGEEKKIELGRFCSRDCSGMENLNPRLMAVDIGDDEKWYLPGNSRAGKGWWNTKYGDIAMLHWALMAWL